MIAALLAAQAAGAEAATSGLPRALQLGGWAVALAAVIVVPVLWRRLVKVEDARVEDAIENARQREELERRIDALERREAPKG